MLLFQLLTSLVYHSALGAINQSSSNDPKILTNLGGLELDAGNYSGAAFYFHKALSSD